MGWSCGTNVELLSARETITGWPEKKKVQGCNEGITEKMVIGKV
jgi:hypothetical protein